MKEKIENYIYENFTAIFYTSIFLFIFCALSFGQQAGIGSSALKKHNHSGDSQGGSIQALKLTGNFFIEGNNEGNIVMPSTPATGSNFIYYPAKSSLYAGFTNSANSWYVKDVANTINLGSYNQCGNYSSCIGYGASVSTSRYNSHTYGNYLKTTANNAITIGQGNLTNYAVNTDTNSVKIYNDNVLNSGKPIISISSYGVVNINDQLIITTYSVSNISNNSPVLFTTTFTWSSSGTGLFKNSPFVVNYPFPDNIYCRFGVYTHSGGGTNSLLFEPIINYSTYTSAWNTRYHYTTSYTNSLLYDISSLRGAFVAEGPAHYYSVLEVFWTKTSYNTKLIQFISHNVGGNITFETRAGYTSTFDSTDNLTGLIITSDRTAATTGVISINASCSKF